MTIQRRFAPIGGRFEPESLAGLTGIYTLVYTKRFYGKIVPPAIASDKYRTPSDAPFDEACLLEKSFLSKYAEMISDVFGFQCILSSLQDRSWFVRYAIAQLCGKKKDSRAVGPLISALIESHKDSYETQIKIHDALVQIGKPSVKYLVSLLKHANAYLRMDAAFILGDIFDQQAIEPLINSLKDEDEDVRRFAYEALHKITNKDFGADYLKWQNWWDGYKRKIIK